MASWIVHLQIAEKLLDFVSEKDEIQFIVGNIGPDCGKAIAGSDDFNPSSKITHWRISEDKSILDAEGFFNAYLMDQKDERRAFYLGYYVHLLTDMAWSSKIFSPVIEKYAEMEISDNELIRRMKRDWYDLDHLYLRKHPDFEIFRLFSEIREFDNIYLDYYEKDSFINQIKLISDFYKHSDSNLDHEYIYLNEQERDCFIEETAKWIRKDLVNKTKENL